jgi:hypothetical protein
LPATGRAFRFCKQPLEVGEHIRDELGSPQIFGSLDIVFGEVDR